MYIYEWGRREDIIFENGKCGGCLGFLRLRLDYLLQIRRQNHNVLVVTPRTLIPMRTN